MKPNIMVCGGSGSGKSTSIRNLNPKTTAIINTEQKQLPFRNAKSFRVATVTTLSEFYGQMAAALSNDEIQTIVVDSFTSLVEMIYKESENTYHGFDVWANYNKEIGNVLSVCKNTDKYVICIAIDGAYESQDGIAERFVKVKGKDWLKSVEKEFVVCLFTDNKITDNGLEYRFRTNTLGNDSAKSPMDMFDLHISNDLKYVIDACEEYYEEEPQQQTKGVI